MVLCSKKPADIENLMRRRDLFWKLTSGFIGFILGLVPLVTGILFFLDPLRRSAKQNGFIRVSSITSLPLGIPRHFSVKGPSRDAWESSAQVPLGAVYLLRQKEKIQAFQVICPHAGCFVGYDFTKRRFLCPCHDSSFKLDGTVANSSSPAPRNLDELAVKIEGDEVLVHYQEFRPGNSKRIPIS